MIHIKRLPKPKELTDELVSAKTAMFEADHKVVVWKDKFIVDTLMSMSHGKCCYCECDITKESNYMEVDHFHDKSDYPKEVAQWDNLLPSCKKCNTTKGAHDTVKYPIINPTIDIPQEHMYLYCGFHYKGKDDLGRETIEALNLDDCDRHDTPRFELAQAIIKKLEEYTATANAFWSGERRITPQGTGRLRNEVIDLMEMGTDSKPYSAVYSTNILNHPDYSKLKDYMQKLNIWNQQLADLETEIAKNCYDMR